MVSYVAFVLKEFADLKKGSLARIGPKKIVTDDPVIWMHMSAPRTTFRKGTWYDSMTLNPRVKNSLSERDEKAHGVLRSKMIRGVYPIFLIA